MYHKREIEKQLKVDIKQHATKIYVMSAIT